jgi:hypothetical protein
MRLLVDHRLSGDSWPVERALADAEAASWMAHMRAEAEERNWPSHGLGQLHPEENSGSLTFCMGQGVDAPTIEVSWEKPRRGRLLVRARAATPPHSSDAQAFIEAVDGRHRERRLHREHRRGVITYQGIPWKGELWLTPDIRFGPPSRQPPVLMGRQAFLVDAMVSGIGRQGVSDEFHRLVREIKLVLGPILAIAFDGERQHFSEWVPEIDDRGQITDCKLRSVGYVELETVDGMPKVGVLAPTALQDVSRPDLQMPVIRASDLSVRPPGDLMDLWKAFCELSAQKREQYLGACNCFATANLLWPAQRTAYATFLVVAGEALKPRTNRYSGANLYDVINSLLGARVAGALKSLALSPQQVRSDHVHRGMLVADELLPRLMGDDFKDPSFDETLTQLTTAVRACLIEWLRCRGEYTFKWVRRAPRARAAPRGARPRRR